MRAYLGLALLGWGLSVLSGVTPHEERWVGAGLAIFGLALVTTARRLPEPPRLPGAAVAGLGLALVAVTVASLAPDHGWPGGPKAVLLLFGLGLAATAPVLQRRLTWGRRGSSLSVAALVLAALAVLGAPLAVWGVQAVSVGVAGTTPVEGFVRIALLAPLAVFLKGLGLAPSVTGQTLTYATPRGPLAVEVGAACSGVQAMALFAALLAIFLWVEKPGGRRLAVWTAIGLGGVYVANLLRLAVLTLVGYRWGADALVRVHAQAGWMFFVGWALLFGALVRMAKSRALRTV